MADDALTTVTLRNQFYRDSYRRVLMALLMSLMINFGLGSLLIYMVTHPPAPKYFATSINGRITPLTPLGEPNQSDSAVLQWANTAAIATFTYNFVNYRQELQAASEFFTPDGWRDFLDALKSTNNLEAVKAKKLIVSAVATRAPIVLQKGILGGRYSWRVQMPILVTYQSASEFSQERDMVTMLITRISTLNSPRGIGIAQFVVEPASGTIR
jgi:intracellular multiplication protein IcmL